MKLFIASKSALRRQLPRNFAVYKTLQETLQDPSFLIVLEKTAGEIQFQPLKKI